MSTQMSTHMLMYMSIHMSMYMSIHMSVRTQMSVHEWYVGPSEWDLSQISKHMSIHMSNTFP